MYADLPTFQIVGDNCDIHQRASHETLSCRDKDHHWFNIYAVKDRIQGLHLPDDYPIASVATLPLATFLPTIEDCLALRKCFIILVACVLMKYIPWFKFLLPVTSDHIRHKYSDVLVRKSEMVCNNIYMYITYYK